MDNAIIISNISKVYKLNSNSANVVKVLDDISYSVKKGETIGVLGKNGCGKTTLLRMIAGLTQPSNGTITISGKIIAIVELGSGFHPELSGIENINYYAQILGFSHHEVKSQIENIIAFSEIGNYINEPVKTYSKGMYLRLAYSIVVHLDADIYLFDEVFAVGDKFFKEKCVKNLLELKERGKTVLITGHDFDLISSVCSDFIEIENGKIKDPEKSKHALVGNLLELELDKNIVLKKAELIETEYTFEFMIELEKIYGYMKVDVLCIIEVNNNFSERFVIISKEEAAPFIIERDYTSSFKVSIEKDYFNKGPYSLSLHIIKDGVSISKLFPNCIKFVVEKNEINYLPSLFPGPIRLFGNFKTIN